MLDLELLCAAAQTEAAVTDRRHPRARVDSEGGKREANQQ